MSNKFQFIDFANLSERESSELVTALETFTPEQSDLAWKQLIAKLKNMIGSPTDAKLTNAIARTIVQAAWESLSEEDHCVKIPQAL